MRPSSQNAGECDQQRGISVSPRIPTALPFSGQPPPPPPPPLPRRPKAPSTPSQTESHVITNFPPVYHRETLHGGEGGAALRAAGQLGGDGTDDNEAYGVRDDTTPLKATAVAPKGVSPLSGAAEFSATQATTDAVAHASPTTASDPYPILGCTGADNRQKGSLLPFVSPVLARPLGNHPDTSNGRRWRQGEGRSRVNRRSSHGALGERPLHVGASEAVTSAGVNVDTGVSKRESGLESGDTAVLGAAPRAGAGGARHLSFISEAGAIGARGRRARGRVGSKGSGSGDGGSSGGCVLVRVTTSMLYKVSIWGTIYSM